ncbi:uncharacterized protein STEHIDRAFT_125481 [Stereum hirsutum FP-91666 SS1]|uniref:uncharacterized protein n=1 Tax=Stereum hirsutum (strain FP-91666) TaxID=721885 RepID=UPI0004449EFF|nr:uncharacterized protein STEHIDRAFT_125481 [Stereum hirsutum FP-91666 SS1]EIM81217.1 hypothetical protein STEHIDRAFT_125481 [Stereum hirsutum FP-91666 SS1]
MSTPSSASLLQSIITLDQLWVIGCYTALSATCIWMIDFVQTLPIQIEAAWSRKSTGSAVIYLVNRYTFGMSIILSLVPLSSGTASDKTSSCSILWLMSLWLGIIAILAMNLLFALRVYAVCGQSRLILYIALLMTIARFGVDIWDIAPVRAYAYVSTQGTPFDLYSMCITLVIDTHVYNSASVITAALPLAYDTFVFGIIMLKTYRHAAEMRKHGQTSITEVLLRDGALYFL